jgi:superfamily II DNA/RNA helicase
LYLLKGVCTLKGHMIDDDDDERPWAQDTMFDAGFGADIKKLLIPLRRHEKKQCVMVAATMSKPVRALMTEQVRGGHPFGFSRMKQRGRKISSRGEVRATQRARMGTAKSISKSTPESSCKCTPRATQYGDRGGIESNNPQLPEMRDVTASSLHRAANNCKHEFLRVPGHDDKLDYLRTLIDKDVRNGDQTMVFCNTVDSCRAVQHAMSEAQVGPTTGGVRCVCV